MDRWAVVLAFMRARRVVAAAAAIVVLALAAAGPASADSFYFPNTSADTSNPASSCASSSPAPCSLRDAVTLAGNSSIDASVVLTAGTTYALTQGSDLPIAGTVGNPAHNVTIDGNGATINASGNGDNDAMQGGNDGLDLDAVTITGASQGAVSFQGGGALELESDTFSGDGSSTANGAPVYVLQAGSLVMDGDTFTGNQGASGGGLEIDSVTGAATLTGLAFTNNDGDAFVVGGGGGTLGSLSIDHVVLRQNVGLYYGVASINSGSTAASVSNVDAEDNMGGKAVRGTLTFYGHYATLDNITSADNTLDSEGAGVRLAPTSTVTATNWTVSGNTSTAGAAGSGPAEAGGVDVVGGAVRLNHATIADNTASGNADDLHTAASGSVTLVNSIIDGSSATGAIPCAADGGPITSGGHNIDRGGSCGFTAAGDVSNTDPRLGALSQTFPVSTRPLGYASPAVDAADNPNCPLTDAIGTARPVGSGCDIGAVESPLTNLDVTATAAPDQLAADGDVTYTFTVSNVSGTVPQGIQFTDALPAAAVVLSARTTSGSCSTDAQVSCTLPGVARGGEATITIVAKLVQPGVNADSAHVQSELPDSDMSNDNATVSVGVVSAPGAAPTIGPPGGPQATLSRLRISPKAFRSGYGRQRGATIRYTASVAGQVTFTVLRRLRGIRIKARCVKRTGRSRRRKGACTRLARAGSFARSGRAGTNVVEFAGRVGGHLLKPGAYELRAAEQGAKTVVASFTVQAPMRRARPRRS